MTFIGFWEGFQKNKVTNQSSALCAAITSKKWNEW